ncbi:transglycosylase SLT domain-containing protein [Limibacillus halophilus]
MRPGRQVRGARWSLRALFFCLFLLVPTHLQAADSARDQEEVISSVLEPMTGDLDAIAERGLLRIAIPYNPLFFAYDGEKMIGLAVERAQQFEAFLARSLGKRVDVVLVPLPRDRILPAVIEGRADIASANLTITPERQALVAFSRPLLTDVKELVVTGPGAGEVKSFDDLALVGLHLRPSSSYYGHVQALNKRREAAGQPPIPLTEADERLEDYDLLDLVEAGVVAAIVVDKHKLDLWRQVFERITVHEELVLNEGGEIAWALRKDTPLLMEATNAFLKDVKEGSLIGNILLDRYLGSPEWILAIREGEAMENYEEVAAAIREEAKSQGFDWRMILAQAYQESKLDHSKVSDAGAQGVMQILPSTAADPNVGVPDIASLEENVKAGVTYLRFLRDRYFKKPEIEPLDEVLFSLAAYNAGRQNIARARKKAKAMGLDPNIWFSNVEIAAAKTVGREPVIYVRNIYKYYVSLSLMELRSTESAKGETLKKSVRTAGGLPEKVMFAGLILGLALLGTLFAARLRRRRNDTGE